MSTISTVPELFLALVPDDLKSPHVVEVTRRDVTKAVSVLDLVGID